MLGIAMVAAVAAMAFIGAGTASATLCKVNQTPCQAANQYPAHSTVLVSSKSVLLTASFATVHCESHATLLHEGIKGGELFGTISDLLFTNCETCTKVTTTTQGTFDDKATGGGNGTILPLNTVVLLQNCPFGLDCTAKAINGTTSLGLDGGTINGTAKGLANTTVATSGFGCGSTGTWKTTQPYIVLSVNGSAVGSIFIV